MAPQEQAHSARPFAKRRKSLADEMAARRKPTFKAELNAAFNFRWPVLNEVDSGVVLMKLQDDPSIRALASRARQRSEATVAARTEARKRRKLAASRCENQPSQDTAATVADLRRVDRRASARHESSVNFVKKVSRSTPIASRPISTRRRSSRSTYVLKKAAPQRPRRAAEGAGDRPPRHVQGARELQTWSLNSNLKPELKLET